LSVDGGFSTAAEVAAVRSPIGLSVDNLHTKNRVETVAVSSSGTDSRDATGKVLSPKDISADFRRFFLVQLPAHKIHTFVFTKFNQYVMWATLRLAA